MVRILDLCAGTGSVKRAMPGVEVISVDMSSKYNPTIQADILKWNYKAVNIGKIDIIWASPPCTHYSPAKTIGPRSFKTADAIVKKCFEIIDYFKPTYWFLENPGKAGQLHRRPFMKHWNRYLKECSYCRYGYGYKKPTNIWTNRKVHLKTCTTQTPCVSFKKYGKHLFTAQCTRNSKDLTKPGTSRLKDRYSVPPKLIRELLHP